MKRTVSLLVVVTLLALGLFAFASVAGAGQEVKMIGVVTKINIAGKSAKTATVILKNNKTVQIVEVAVIDELTLDKLKDHRIVEGDEVRCKYEIVDGRNICKLLRKTAGC